MPAHFHRITVKEVKKETDDCVSILLDIPEAWKETFRYSPGQHISLRTFINGNEVRRTYSLCSSPLEDEWRIAVKKIPGGLFSTYANEQLKKGDPLEITTPAGRFFTPLQRSNKKNYLAIAAGSGITPILSILRTTLQVEPESSFTLVYGNRNRRSILFLEALEALKNQYIDRFALHHLLSREEADTALHNGRIGKEKLQQWEKILPITSMHEIFLCGPLEMLQECRDYFMEKRIPEAQIHFEIFHDPGQTANAGKKISGKPEKNTDTRMVIKLDGRTIECVYPSHSSSSILEVANAKGHGLPFACKGGMCCTCKAKLLKGKINMDVHWGLDAEEIAKGYILTCQSRPLSNELIIDFDQ